MRILQRDLKHGTIKVLAETSDDLWYLSTVIDAKDHCVGSTEYKFKLGGAEGKQKVVKKRVWAKVEVEKTELATGQLRISGLVVDGAQELPRGSHLTLDIEEGSDVQITKQRWLDFQLEKLDEATQSGASTLVVLFDRESALFVKLQPRGHEKLLELKGDVQKKQFDEGKTKSFYKEIATHVQEYMDRLKLHKVIAASPAFWKEYLRKELSDDLAKKVIFSTVSSASETAIPELLQRPELQQALAGERAARETELVANYMEALAKDKLAYGLADVQQVLSDGNCKELAVTERQVQKTREEGTFAVIEQAMNKAADLGAKVHLLSTSDAVQKIDGLGGIVAVKRW